MAENRNPGPTAKSSSTSAGQSSQELGADEKRQLSTWALLGRLVAISWQYRHRCLGVLLLQIAVIVMSLSGLRFAGLGIDYIRWSQDRSTGHPDWPLGLEPPAHWAPMTVILAIAGAILLVAALWCTIRYVATVAQARLVQDLVVNLRTQVYAKLQKLSFHFYDANASGSIINRVTADTRAIQMFLATVIMQTLTLVVTLTVFIGYMLSTHVWLTIACLATTPIMAVFAWRFSTTIKPMYVLNRKLRDQMVLVLSEHVLGVHVVKGFAREQEQIERFKAASEKVHNQSNAIYTRLSNFVPTIGLFTQLNLCILLVYGGYLVINDQLALGSGLIVFAGLLSNVSAQMQNIAQIANTIQASLAGAERVFEILDTPVEIKSPEEPIRLKECKGHIKFDGVFFAYKNEDPVLRDVDFEVQPGECVAILGATGAGKSSLLSLIPRFYDPQFGRVLLDGSDLRKFDLDDLRRQIGLVFQESFLFSMSVSENISFGHPKASREQIETAAKIAAAHDFISALPQGYDTVIGERGSDLSGGQRQRLAIARAVLLDPAILILDDATAAIDPETEHEILSAMSNAMEGRTTFVVAHRLSMMRRADKVIVLDNGRIVQAGRHEELMSVHGPYRNAARLQEADAESKRLLGVA